VNFTLEQIKREAQALVEPEERRELLRKEIERIRAEKWWHKFVPFKIVIIRRK
jgi:hypothetical protein